jgi:hypothetical protein
MAMDVSCVMTVVKNVTGESRFFSYLGAHGVTLAADEEFSVLGSLPDHVQRGQYGDRGGSQWTDALLSDLGENADNETRLEIVSTPSPILYDPTLAESQMVVLDNGTLDLFDPCWASAAA